MKRKECFFKETYPAVLTVEATIVMFIVLCTVAGMLLFSFSVHDRYAAKNALVYAMELYSHRNAGGEGADDYLRVAENRDIYLLGDRSGVTIRSEIGGVRTTGTAYYGEDRWSVSNWHLKTPLLLRAATLKDAVKKEEEEKKDDNTGNKQP